jgi:hypothetical protein
LSLSLLQFPGIDSNIRYILLDHSYSIGGILHRKGLLTSSSGRQRIFDIFVVLCAAAIVVAPSKCLAQDLPDFHPYTADIGGGITPVFGSDGNSLQTGYNLRVGGGFAVTPRPVEKYEQGYLLPTRRLSVYIAADFMFNQSDTTSSTVALAIISNPQIPALLSATSGKAKFYSTTLGPTFRYQLNRHANVYALAGFGWLRRTIEFNGVSGQGTLLLPSSPAVSASGGNSGAFDAGGGINIGPFKQLGGLMFYAEARVLRGLAINNGTTLAPLSFGIRW